jgi:hypothetical protein
MESEPIVESDPPDSPTDSPHDSDVDTAPGTWRSALYPEEWTPDFTDADGYFLHDFSYAGYHAGEAEPPDVTERVSALDLGADPTGTSDSTSAIQDTIDAAAALATADSPVAAWLPAGTYRVDGTLTVDTSGVVLQGDGTDTTFVFFTQTEGLDYSAHLRFTGGLTDGVELALSADADNRATTVQVADASAVSVGDEVAVGWVITDDFVSDHEMTGTWVEFNGEWRAFFRRTVVAVDTATGTITLDVPLRYPALVRDSASVRVQTGYLTEVGLEDIALSNAADWETAWGTTQVHLVALQDVKDGWVRRVASWESTWPTDGEGMHLISSGIEVVDSRRVTIADVELADAAHRGDGGNGYLFEISRSNEVLTRDSVGRAGRHNFIQNWDFGTSGCVWLRVQSSDGRSLLGDWDPVGYKSYSEYHHSLAMANLVDSAVAEDGWQGVNRQSESSGAGQSVTQSVFWNLSGGGYLRSLQYGDGYVIGTTDMDVHVDPDEADWNNSGEGTEPTDWTEGLDEGGTLDPPSLYEDQLSRRLGG